MLYCGETIKADRARELGLVSEVTKEGQALSRALELAEAAAKMPPKAISAIKQTLKQGTDLLLDAALKLENREFLLLFDTADKTEGMRAFLEKRTAVFQGK